MRGGHRIVINNKETVGVEYRKRERESEESNRRIRMKMNRDDGWKKRSVEHERKKVRFDTKYVRRYTRVCIY